jgi:P27 family predicted phage terminase small subunit
MLAPSAFKKNKNRNERAGRSLIEPAFPKIDLDVPPPILEHDEKAQEIWRELAPILTSTKIMTMADANMLVVYCQVFADYLRDLHTVSLEGRMVESERGRTKHPLLSVISDNRGKILQMSQQFGITPSARSKVAAVEKTVEKDEFEEV